MKAAFTIVSAIVIAYFAVQVVHYVLPPIIEEIAYRFPETRYSLGWLSMVYDLGAKIDTFVAALSAASFAVLVYPGLR